MEVKLQEKIKAAVEVDGKPYLNFENSMVYENIEGEEMFLYLKSNIEGKEIKIRFIKTE